MGVTGRTGQVGVTGRAGPVGVTGRAGPVGVTRRAGPVGFTRRTGPFLRVKGKALVRTEQFVVAAAKVSTVGGNVR